MTRFLCRLGWHRWTWWEIAGVAAHPAGLPNVVQRRICGGCGRTEQRDIGAPLHAEMCAALNAGKKIMEIGHAARG